MGTNVNPKTGIEQGLIKEEYNGLATKGGIPRPQWKEEYFNSIGYVSDPCIKKPLLLFDKKINLT